MTDDLLDGHQLRSRSPATCTAATAAASAAAATAATARLRRRLLLLRSPLGLQSASGGALNLEAGYLLAGVGIADIEALRLRPAGEPLLNALTIKVVASRRVMMANVAWTTLIADVPGGTRIEAGSQGLSGPKAFLSGRLKVRKD